MEFYFKQVGDEKHLYRENGIFDEDLGVLIETSDKKMKTKHFLKENFYLEDISGMFSSKGTRYRIKSSKGLGGVIEKKTFSDRYVLK